MKIVGVEKGATGRDREGQRWDRRKILSIVKE